MNPGMNMMLAGLPPLTWARAFTSWQFHPLASITALVLLSGYAAAVAVVRRKGLQTDWSPRATVSWVLGVALFTVATQGSIDVYGDALFWLHMVGHLMLIMLVPLCLIGGKPLQLLISVVPSSERVLRGRVASVLLHPLVTLALYAIVIAGAHLTGFMNSMMLHPWLHGAETAAYVVVGFMFFLPLVSDAPVRWRLVPPMRMAVLAVAMPIDTFTGVILGQTQRYPWPLMAAAHPPWALSLLNDLHAGGGVMWVGGDAIMAILMGFAAAAWMRSAGDGSVSELGDWLTAARPTGDSDDDLASYNRYLAGLDRGISVHNSGSDEG